MEFIKRIFGNKKQVATTGDISSTGSIWCVSHNGTMETGTIELVVTDVPSNEFVGMQLYSKVVDIRRGFYAAELNILPIDKLMPLIRKGKARQMTWAELSKL
jgi:hypothetical protein